MKKLMCSLGSLSILFSSFSSLISMSSNVNIESHDKSSLSEYFLSLSKKNNFKIKNYYVKSLVEDKKGEYVFKENIKKDSISNILPDWVKSEFKSVKINESEYKLLNKKINNPSWDYNVPVNLGNYKFVVRADWWTFLTFFFNIDSNENFSKDIEEGRLDVAEVSAMLVEISAEFPYVVIAVGSLAIVILGLASVWKGYDKGNGIYQDFEILIPGKCATSDQSWNNV